MEDDMYKSKDLSVLSYANGFTLWHYVTADSVDGVNGPGYFDDAAHMLRTGDMILVNAGEDATPSAVLLLVASNAGGAIQVSNMTAVPAQPQVQAAE